MQSRPSGGESTQKSMRTRQREKLAEGANTEGMGITDMGLMPGKILFRGWSPSRLDRLYAMAAAY